MRQFITLVEALLGKAETTGWRGETEYFVNPSYAETTRLLARSPSHELRGVIIGGNVYLWVAEDEIHAHGAQKLHTEFGIGQGRADKLIWVIQKGGEISVMMNRTTGGYRMGFWTIPTDKLPARLRRAVVAPELLRAQTPMQIAEMAAMGTGMPGPEIVPVLAKRMFDTGMMCSHGTDLATFCERYDDEPWWDTRADNVLSTPKFRRGFVKWLGYRYRHATDQLRFELGQAGDWPVPVKRTMVVPRDWINRFSPKPHLGVFWAIDIPEVSFHDFGSMKTGSVDVYMHARAPETSVDWPETLMSRMDYLNGDDEGELQIRPSAPLELLRIEDGTTGEDLPFPPGMYPA